MTIPEITTRICTKADGVDIERIILSNSSMYGLTLKGKLHERHIELVEDAMLDKTKCVVGVFREDRMVGLGLMKFSADLPLWYILVCYIEQFKDRTQFAAPVLGGVLFDGMLEIAEQKKYYDFYYVVRDHMSIRKNMTESHSVLLPRYDMSDIEELPPLTKSKFATINYLLGDLALTHKRTVVVKSGWLRKEFRSY